MQQREKALAAGAAVVVLLWVGLPVWNRIVSTPVEEKRRELAGVDEELAAQLKDVADVKRAGVLLEQWRRRSLPPDDLDAQRLYLGWLTDLAQMSGFKNLKVTPGRRIPSGKVFTSVLFSLEAEAQYSQLRTFLKNFYRVDLAHRINQIEMKPAESRGDPSFQVEMMIEGLSVSGADERSSLFPQAVLKEGFQSNTSGRDIVVDDAQIFPEKAPFLVQIGHEFLEVTQVRDNRWTVIGGRDATAPLPHDAGDVVQLVPIVQTAAAGESELRNPFVKPAPPVSAPVRSAPPPTAPPRDTSASETYLAACITADDESQAWLYRESNQKKTVMREGDSLELGGIRATVVDIERDRIVLKNDAGRWHLRIGGYWADMNKLPDEAREPLVGAEPADRTSAE